MLEYLHLDELDEKTLMEILISETKNFTALLCSGLDDRELDAYCYDLNLIINEIRIRRGKNTPDSFPHLA
ncbi:MAG: hypothetical protein C5B59_03635 [Bacteroidetes bacterium]|nr:MAG: hypothetical protein C5B59_03635 [Bacteroidota bacterium]